MKIDIRDETISSEITEIVFAERANGNTILVGVGIGTPTIDIECFSNSDECAIVSNEDIPNLIKALQKVCELKGIEQ